MSSGLHASESGAHWSLTLEDMLSAVFGIVEDEGGKTRVLLIGFDGEADAVAIILIAGMFEEFDFGLGVLWLFTNLEKALIYILSHGEAFGVLSSDTVSCVIEFSFPGWATKGFSMTG